MKNLKFLLFAVAMLLTVCLQAENKPETVANVNPQPVEMFPENTNQVACVIVWDICGHTTSQTVIVDSSSSCEKLAKSSFAVMEFFNTVLGCN
jgi:hypothetical protein